jgi:SAM-dependent MidA family methyltransferase
LSRATAHLLALQEELGGTLPFERFMREALYHPEFGYYTARIRDVGARGDFSTFATLGNALAEFLSRWIIENKARDVIEVGPGNGQLAAQILGQLGWWRRRSIRYHLVDVDGPLRATQDQRLRGFRVQRHPDLASALRATDGRAWIFSNELPDAFPCRVFELTPDGWLELHLRLGADGIHEILRPAELPESTAFAGSFRPGQRVEIHESHHQWLRGWAAQWTSGSMLTIDYGDTLPTLYHRRPGGTLRGYAHHQRLTGLEIYQAPGRLDLTADVNFSDLEKWGEDLGWRTTRHGTLNEFLGKETAPPFLEAAKAFRVLEQCPGGKA